MRWLRWVVAFAATWCLLSVTHAQQQYDPQGKARVSIYGESTNPGDTPLSVNALGQLAVICISGCSGGGGGSTFGSAFPSTGTAIGVKNGANMVNLNADASGNLDVNCTVGCAGGTFNNSSDGVATSATNGQSAAWLYAFNGSTFDRLRDDGSFNLKVNCAVGCSASGNQTVIPTNAAGQPFGGLLLGMNNLPVQVNQIPALAFGQPFYVLSSPDPYGQPRSAAMLTDGKQYVGIAAANVAATADKPALTVALSPNTPLPAGFNLLGGVQVQNGSSIAGVGVPQDNQGGLFSLFVSSQNKVWNTSEGAWDRMYGDSTNGTWVNVKAGTVAATQSGGWTVTANQGGTWTVQQGGAPWADNITQVAGNSVTTFASGEMLVGVDQHGTWTVAATESGTWTVQPGNTANTTPWLMTINQGGNSATVTASNALKVDGSAVTQPVSGTVTANQGGAPWSDNITQVAGGSITTVATGEQLVSADQHGTWTVTQSGTWTVQQGGAPWSVNGNVSNASSGVATTSTNVPAVAYLYAFNGTTWDQLQDDGSKNLKVNCAVGCSGGSFNNNSDAVATSSTNGQAAAWLYAFNGTTWDRLRDDGSFNLKVNCAVGCGGSGTVSNASSGQATTSTNIGAVAWMYAFNGSTWDQLQDDGSKNLKVNCVTGCASSGGLGQTAINNAAGQPIGGLLPGQNNLPVVVTPGAVIAQGFSLFGATDGLGQARTASMITDGQHYAAVAAANISPVAAQPSLVVALSPNSAVTGVSQSGAWSVTANQGGSWSVNQAGTWTVQQGGAPWSQNTTQIAGGSITTVATGEQLVSADQHGSWTVTANAGTGNFNENLAQVNGSTVSTAASGVQKVGITGNTGAAMDAAGQNASSPANELLVGCQFNTSPTAITSGNISPCQLDTNGNLLVDIKAGTVAATQSGTWTVQQGSPPWSNNITQIAGNSVVTFATGEMMVGADQHGTWTVQPGNTANTTPWLMTINQGGNSATVTASNALKVDGSAVTQPVSGTVTANQGGAPWSVNGAVSNASSGVATSSTNVPAVAYMYAFNGSTWDQLQDDGSKNLKVNCVTGCSGSAGIAQSELVNSAGQQLGAILPGVNSPPLQVTQGAYFNGLPVGKLLNQQTVNIFTGNPTDAYGNLQVAAAYTDGHNYAGVTAPRAPATADKSAVVVAMSPNSSWAPILLNALSTTVKGVKASPGNLGMLQCYNPNASQVYIQVFNTTPNLVTLGTTTPLQSYAIAPTATGGLSMTTMGIRFDTAISVAATTTATGSTAAGTAPDCNMAYN